MSTLREILGAANVSRALVIDDAYDEIPLASDLDIDFEEWTEFFDDLSSENRKAISTAFPSFEDAPADQLKNSDSFVRVLWKRREEIGAQLLEPLFGRYERDKQSDLARLGVLTSQLAEAGLQCDTIGRDFVEAALGYDLLFIDLYLSSSQRSNDIDISIHGLADVISQRKERPPLVILMSSSGRIFDKREEFRDRAHLFESIFRILPKQNISDGTLVQRLLIRLADHYLDSLRFAAFVTAWEDGLKNAAGRTTKLIRKLALADIAQIHQLLLNFEGEPAGTYLLDVFENVLQHEIERDQRLIEEANGLKDLTSDKYPPPYVPGSRDLQDLVHRSIFQNRNRLGLPGAIESKIAFGDVLRRKPGNPGDEGTGDEADGKGGDDPLAEVSHNYVLAVLSPACDLQRKGAKRVLLLVGDLHELTPEHWTYKDDGVRTPVLELPDAERRWIKWNIKHIETASHHQLEKMLFGDAPTFEVVARLRESHALELQQKLLSSLGRVGMTPQLPATFPVVVEAFLPGADGKLLKLPINELDAGGVCYVGRAKDRKERVERLVLPEDACEAVCSAVSKADLAMIHQKAHAIIKGLTKSEELLQALEKGIVFHKTQGKKMEIKSADGKPVGFVIRGEADITAQIDGGDIPKMGIYLAASDPTAAGASAEHGAEESAVVARNESKVNDS